MGNKKNKRRSGGGGGGRIKIREEPLGQNSQDQDTAITEAESASVELFGEHEQAPGSVQPPSHSGYEDLEEMVRQLPAPTGIGHLFSRSDCEVQIYDTGLMVSHHCEQEVPPWLKIFEEDDPRFRRAVFHEKARTEIAARAPQVMPSPKRCPSPTAMPLLAPPTLGSTPLVTTAHPARPHKFVPRVYAPKSYSSSSRARARLRASTPLESTPNVTPESESSRSAAVTPEPLATNTNLPSPSPPSLFCGLPTKPLSHASRPEAYTLKMPTLYGPGPFSRSAAENLEPPDLTADVHVEDATLFSGNCELPNKPLPRAEAYALKMPRLSPESPEPGPSRSATENLEPPDLSADFYFKDNKVLRGLPTNRQFLSPAAAHAFSLPNLTRYKKKRRH